MDIEELSKVQLILLALLVSFVTSIATGIVTVSLMSQAPPVIAQTVNRVIERTIETVASTTPRGQTAATVITQEKTVVVKETDLISQAVGKATPSVVRIFDTDSDPEIFLGLGVVFGEATILTDIGALGTMADAHIQLSDGSRVRAFVTSRDTDSGIAYLSAATTTSEGKAVTWTPIAISADQPVLGESVVMLAGKTTMRISDGIITSLGVTSHTVDTSISGDAILPGSPLIDTTGSLIGISTTASQAVFPSGFITSASLVKKNQASQ